VPQQGSRKPKLCDLPQLPRRHARTPTTKWECQADGRWRRGI